MAKRWVVFFLVGCLSLLIVAQVLAAPQAYSLNWWTVDNGGGTSDGGIYSLSGTVGQPDAGDMSGGEYLLSGGFWSKLITQVLSWLIYLPITIR